MGDAPTSRGRPRARASLASTLVLAGVCLSACQSPPDGDSSAEGQLVLSVTIAGGATIVSVSWTVTSSSQQVLATGGTNTDASGATASFAVGLPPGKGDVVTMTATTSAGDTCAGSSPPFDVVHGQTSLVTLPLSCQSATPDAGFGAVLVTANVVRGDDCPVLGSWSISSQTAAADGGRIDVSAAVTDPDDGDTLSYRWSAPAGSFANPGLATTTYTCGVNGTEVLRLSVSDDHSPSACTIDVAFPAVSCD